MQPSSRRDRGGFRKWCLEAKSWKQTEFEETSRRVQAGFNSFRFDPWFVASRLAPVQSLGSAEGERNACRFEL